MLLKGKNVFEIWGQDIKNIMVWINFFKQMKYKNNLQHFFITYNLRFYWSFIPNVCSFRLSLLNPGYFSQSQQTCKALQSCLSLAGTWFSEVRAERRALCLGQWRHIAILILLGEIHWRCFLSLLFYLSNLVHIVNDGLTVARSGLHSSGRRSLCNSFDKCQNALTQNTAF